MNDVASQGAETAPGTPGAALARARQARGLSVSDVAMHLKFAPRQIDALEADDYAALPGGTFVRGMVRTYARFLGLDAEALAREVGTLMGGGSKPIVAMPDLKVPFQPGPKRSSRMYLFLSLAVLAAAGLVAADWVLRMREAANVAAPASAPQSTASAAVPIEPQPTPAPSADQTPGAAAPMGADSAKASDAQSKAPIEPASPPLAAATKRLRLEFDRDSWVEIKDAEGNTLLSKVNPAGSKQVVEGVAPLQIVIGNASGVRMAVNDEAFDLKPFTRVDIARITLD
jgi:cytoskeleton protein RodZ